LRIGYDSAELLTYVGHNLTFKKGKQGVCKDGILNVFVMDFDNSYRFLHIRGWAICGFFMDFQIEG
jgi:hypothetical protein